MNYTSGRLGLDATSRSIDAITAKSDGGFSKANVSFQRLQRLSEEVSLNLSLEGQRADKNLASAEKLVLGGVHGVRAYPQGKAAGDEGQLASLEVRWKYSERWQITGFYDDGQVTVNRTPWGAGDNSRHLSGAGVGATFTSGTVVNLMAAWRTGSGGSPTSDTDRSPRLWLRAIRYF